MFKNLFTLAHRAERRPATCGRISARGRARRSRPAAQSCGSLQWKITSQTGGQASGDFSATCADGVTLAGTMTATHGETSIPWAATGTATKGDGDVPLQHDRYRHLPGHVEHRS